MKGRKTQKEKKSHGVQLLLRAVVRDPDGKVITDTGRKPSKCFVIQFLEFLYFWFQGTNAGMQTATQIHGTEDNFYWAGRGNLIRLKAPVNEGLYGIVVGTGDTAATNVDYKLDAKIAEGAGAGQITHGVTIAGITAVVGANVDLETKRAFTNNSGSTITVKEAGFYSEQNLFGDPQFCMVRDVQSPAIEVQNRCSLTIYYTFRTTV